MLKSINGITHYSSTLLESTTSVVHAFLGRTGGVSSGHLSSLNMGRRDEDAPGNIMENKRRVAEAFGIDAGKMFTVSQVHGDRVFILDRADLSPEEVKTREADAIVTSINGIAIGVLTADCVPILLHDRKNGVIAAIHAGWKGTAQKIARKCVKTMQERFGTEPKHVTAAIGPAIGPCCYRVNDDVVAAVGYTDRVAKPCEFHWKLDLQKANMLQLQEEGVVEIDNSGICTSCRNDLFFSHRKEGGRTGRQLSFICMRSEV
jgi:YfiH family protein